MCLCMANYLEKWFLISMTLYFYNLHVIALNPLLEILDKYYKSFFKNKQYR